MSNQDQSTDVSGKNKLVSREQLALLNKLLTVLANNYSAYLDDDGETVLVSYQLGSYGYHGISEYTITKEDGKWAVVYYDGLTDASNVEYSTSWKGACLSLVTYIAGQCFDDIMDQEADVEAAEFEEACSIPDVGVSYVDSLFGDLQNKNSKLDDFLF